MNSPASVDEAWSIDQWNSALGARYFSRSFELEPVTFCVDADELASIRGLAVDGAVEELTGIVRDEVMPGFDFARVWLRCEQWRDDGCPDEPPSLPLLALNVLAAGRMMSRRVGAPNFYGPFRQMLDPLDEAGGMPGNYDEYIPRMWEQLAWWLDDHLCGARGMSTITKHDHFVNVGYARQQAVLHASDRRRLHRFLRSIRFEPGDEVVPEELRRALAIWASRLGPVGDRLTRLATDQALVPYADELLRRIAERWDGRTRDPRTGVPVIPIRVLVEDRPFAVALVAKHDDDHPTKVSLTGPVDGLELVSRGTYYSPVPVPLDVAHVLDSGAEISGDSAALTFDPAPIVPLAWDDDLAGWVSTNGISFGEIYCLLVRKEAWPCTKAWIVDEGLAGDIDTAATPALPSGWFLIRRFRVDARPRQRPPDGLSDLLRSAGGSQTRLVGGLPLSGLRRTYLLGGLPFFAIPSDAEVVAVDLELDGFDPVRLRAEEGELPLNEINLGPGRYTVRHPRGSLEFDVLDGLSQSPGRDAGSVHQVGKNGRQAQGLIATLPSPDAPVALDVPPGSTSIVIGPRPGDVSLVEIPRWLNSTLGELSWRSADVWCDFKPVWLITRGTPYSATLIEPHEPVAGPADSTWASLVVRAQLASESGIAVELWQRYKEIAAQP